MIFRYPPKLSIADNYRPIQKQNYSRPLTYINRKAMYHLIPTKYFLKIGFFFFFCTKPMNQWPIDQFQTIRSAGFIHGYYFKFLFISEVALCPHFFSNVVSRRLHSGSSSTCAHFRQTPHSLLEMVTISNRID